jgi:type VI secretion system secreted protein VgrG
MSGSWSRSLALMAMTSALPGTDTLIPISLSAHEAISRPFQFDVTAVCLRGKIDPNQLLDRPACVILQNTWVSRTAEAVRYFHGIVRSVRAEGEVSTNLSSSPAELYRLALVPRLWFLGQTVDCRVYQQKSAGDILQAMFQDAGLTDFSGPPQSAKRDYTVQFNESDLQFASRLMEEEGWFYFFQHTAQKHTLVIANQNTAFTAIPQAQLFILGTGSSLPDGYTDDTFRLADFNRAGETVRGKMTFRDYDPQNPDTLLESEQPTVLKTGGATQRDHFRWPAVSFDNGVVKDRTKWEMEAAEAAASLYDGASQFGGLVAGGKFSIASKPSSPYDGSYVVRSISHHASDDTWLTANGHAAYSNQFVAFPVAVTWRQPLITPRPRMEGVHTALVMGPQSSKGADIKSQDGQEIYTDPMGRVKVRFYWDWRGESTGDGSVWARVIQPWAGKGWGAQFTPRVGTEVAVAFVDGDPDRPIVIGGLYNGRDTPIYAVADATKSGIRTRSSLKGATKQFSELTFDDKSGSELIFMHAEKDLFTEIENNQTLTVDNCRIVTVKKDETVNIQNNQTITVTQDRSVTVSQGNSTFTVSQGNHSETVSQGNRTETVTQGNYTINVNAGQMSTQAMQSLELTVGQSSIKLTPQGVTISGAQISLTGQMQGSFDGGMQLALKGGMVQIN